MWSYSKGVSAREGRGKQGKLWGESGGDGVCGAARGG